MPRAGTRLLVNLAIGLVLAACTTVRESSPQRTATEQLLISTAVDRAIERVNLKIPSGTKVFVAAEQLKDNDDGKYAAGAMKERLLRNGAKLVDDRGRADAVVDVRAGALSIDEKQTLIGIDTFDAPIPLAGQFKVPQIALYKQKERLGLAKIAAFGYSAADGTLIDASGPQLGYAHEDEKVLLFFFSWRTNDLPKEPKTGVLDIN